MTTKKSTAAAKLRRDAEARLQKQKQKQDAAPLPDHELKKLFHELEVHQIELEIQNEELQNARNVAETAAARYTDLYDFSPTGLVNLTPEGIILQVNLAAAVLLGRAREQLQDALFNFFVAPSNRPDFVRFLLQVFDSEGMETCELLLKTETEPWTAEENEATPCTVLVKATRSADGQECRMMLMDVSEQKELQEKLNYSQRMESVGELAGGIAHDFNNLLSIIQSNFEFLEDFNTSKDDDFQKWIDSGLKTVQRGASLTRRLFNFSKTESTDLTTVNINSLINELRELISKSMTPQIKVEFNLCKDERYVKINTSEFQDAVINMALNARDAMPVGGTLQIATSDARLTKQDVEMYPGVVPGNYVMVSITDTGSGMDKATQGNIYKPFFTTKEEGKGTGLGLSMVYGFTKRSHGIIKVNSEVGHGTTEELYLPLLAERRKVSLDDSKAKESEPPGGTELILIVDDEEDILQSLKHRLESLGYQVLMAKSGDEALEVINSHSNSIDLLLSDVVMPGMTGYELVNEVSKRKLDIKVLLTSGFTGFITKAQTLLSVLRKPYTKKQLADKLREVLDQTNQ